ncbi:MAG: hypothetical protein IH602_16765 [Bryobacteraceae bacterium]|nr:hypothetical protein [Bryobacteraceae bacterium]
MTQRSLVTRRGFLGAAGAAAIERGQAAGQAGAQVISGETEHFWYRAQPAGKYIDSQRGDKAFAYAAGRIHMSADNGHSWPYSAEFPDASSITFSHILKNGNVVFATGASLYLSIDNLKSYRKIKVEAQDGSEYVPHTPANPELPGWYFHTLPGAVSWDVDGAEMMVWGNYCNVLGGATPVNIYYSADSGRTVKIAYSFGQNPFFSDNGRPGGGRGGKLLGDPGNKVLCRHVHAVAYNPAENAFYACTGDLDRGLGHECHWLRGTYNKANDKWDWKVLHSDFANSRYKCGGLNFVNGRLYWISDANGPKPYDRGIFCCAPEDLLRPERHTMLFNPEVESGNMIIQDGVMIASHCAPASPLDTGFIISTDMGRTWAQHDLKAFGKRSPTRLHEKNGEGWFRADLRAGWIERAEVVFIKPKPASSRGGR